MEPAVVPYTGTRREWMRGVRINSRLWPASSSRIHSPADADGWGSLASTRAATGDGRSLTDGREELIDHRLGLTKIAGAEEIQMIKDVIEVVERLAHRIALIERPCVTVRGI